MSEEENKVVKLFSRPGEEDGPDKTIGEMLADVAKESPEEEYDYGIILLATDGMPPKIICNAMHIDTLVAILGRASWAVNMLSLEENFDT